MKQGEAGVLWTEEELALKKDALINSKRYSNRQKSLVSRFFETILLYGGPDLQPLADIMVNDMGDTTR